MNNLKISALIVEDETKSAIVLKRLISAYCADVEIIEIVKDVHSAQKSIQLHSPELLFLDIEIGYGTSFDILKQFHTNDFHVIFTTAYTNYAIEAIKVRAVDYLLKPIQPADLISAVEKIRVIVQKKHTEPSIVSPLDKIAIHTLGRILIFDTNDILFLKASNSYTHIHSLSNGTTVASRNIKEFENLLPSSFFRVHHSYIVNLNHVRQYIQGRGGHIILRNGIKLEVSARKKYDFLNFLRHGGYTTVNADECNDFP